MKIVTDKDSGNLRLPHRVDEATGMYRGKQIFTPKSKKTKGDKKVHGAEPVLPKADRHADHEHMEQKTTKGFLGTVQRSMRPKARSGMGGQSD
jgi:hypothetical protein